MLVHCVNTVMVHFILTSVYPYHTICSLFWDLSSEPHISKYRQIRWPWNRAFRAWSFLPHPSRSVQGYQINCSHFGW